MRANWVINYKFADVPQKVVETEKRKQLSIATLLTNLLVH